MKRFLVLAIVLALAAMPMVFAEPIGSVQGDYCDINNPCSGGQTCQGGQCVPEFTTIGAGIAIIGAGIAYSLIRKKK